MSMFIVMERIRGIQVENPYATSPLEPTSYTTAMRLLLGIRHYEGTDYYIQEVPDATQEQEVTTMTLEQFIQAVESLDYYAGNTDKDYLTAVYKFADEYALNSWDDVENILSIAEDCYQGYFSRPADYGEYIGEEYLSERLDAMQAISMGEDANAGLHIPYTIDWEQFADLILPNAYGWNYSAYDDGQPGTGAHYFREAP